MMKLITIEQNACFAEQQDSNKLKPTKLFFPRNDLLALLISLLGFIDVRSVLLSLFVSAQVFV